MGSVWRVIILYSFLMVIFRLSGKRTLASMTPFDLVMLLVISETTQSALTNSDQSMTNTFLMVSTFVFIDVGMSLLKQRSKWFAGILEDRPLIVVEDGRLLRPQADKARVDVDDVLEAARESQGLERLDQVKYAVLERTGKISIIPVK